MSCTVTDTVTKTVTWNVNIDPKLLNGLEIVITGGYSNANANAHAVARSIKLDNNKCGYFTLVSAANTTAIWCGLVMRTDFAPGACVEDHMVSLILLLIIWGRGGD